MAPAELNKLDLASVCFDRGFSFAGFDLTYFYQSRLDYGGWFIFSRFISVVFGIQDYINLG